MRPALDTVAIEPTLVGPHGRAWAIDLDAAYRQAGKSRDDFADVAQWIVEATFAHPIWHSYWIALQHLRPITPLSNATIFYIEGATHEMWVYALDPDKPRTPMIKTGWVQPLLPMNFAAQIIESSDEAARERVKASVQLICDGTLSPDTDFIRSWVALYGDNMLKDRGRR